mmetsp:Transcript_41185/g.60594  ORF Transcript_41185/g.60594 Transcript_41185/m.60594 type:complete len:90 (-) Transcript_41185:55-324(-)
MGASRTRATLVLAQRARVKPSVAGAFGLLQLNTPPSSGCPFFTALQTASTAPAGSASCEIEVGQGPSEEHQRAYTCAQHQGFELEREYV